MSYHIGRYKDDAPKHRGWFIGTFMDEGATKTDDVEIKYWEFPVGLTTHETKTSTTYECTIFLAGHSRGTIDGREIEFKAGDYVAIQPGTSSNPVIEIIEPVIGLTIKAPSDPSAKRVL
jgi:quercetin dioxygenase-like cupin family protein